MKQFIFINKIWLYVFMKWSVLYIYNILTTPKLSVLQFVTAEHNLQEIKKIYSCTTLGSAQKCWIWRTTDSWKTVCSVLELKADSRLLYAMLPSNVPKEQLYCLRIMVNTHHQNIFIWNGNYEPKMGFFWTDGEDKVL